MAACGGTTIGGAAPNAPAPPAPLRTEPLPQATVPPLLPAVPQPVPGPQLGLPALPTAPAAPRLTPPAGEGPARIAILLPLSGPEQATGRSLLDAALLALFDVGGERITLLPQDTQGTADGARAAAAQALQMGAQLILGPVFSAEVSAVADSARARDVSVVAFSTDASVAGNGVYLLAFMPQQQVERVVGYAISRGLRQFAALAPQTPYGVTVVESLRSVSERFGGTVARTEFYTADAQELMDPVRRLADYQSRHDRLLSRRRQLEALPDDATARRDLAALAGLDTFGPAPFQAVLLPEGGAELRQVAPLLPFFDVDPAQVKFLGTGLWDDPNLGQEPALVGGWFAAPPPDNLAAFSERFNGVFGYRPQRIATLAYDAVALAAALARSGPEFSREALTTPSGFAGTDGIFRFLPSGIADRGLAVLEVQAKGDKVIDPAPTTFQQATN